MGTRAKGGQSYIHRYIYIFLDQLSGTESGGR